jgi:hypothetical protein
MFDSAKQHDLDEFLQNAGPALKFGLTVELVFLVLTVLMLDGGRSLQFFVVALIGHWLLIVLIVARRPLSPTKIDLICIRSGLPLLLIVIGIIAPAIWSIIGESTLSGLERMRGN